MKTILFAIVALASVAFAGQENHGLNPSYNAEEIYNALNVEAVPQNPGFAGQYRLLKSVGGLNCETYLIVGQEKPEFFCSIDNEKQNFGAIYKALNVKAEVLNPGIAGSYRAVKSVGGLTCVASKLALPKAKAKYDCQIQE